MKQHGKFYPLVEKRLMQWRLARKFLKVIQKKHRWAWGACRIAMDM